MSNSVGQERLATPADTDDVIDRIDQRFMALATQPGRHRRTRSRADVIIALASGGSMLFAFGMAAGAAIVR
jgi:hypothetical protein